jgi:hypothetical protein
MFAHTRLTLLVHNHSSFWSPRCSTWCRKCKRRGCACYYISQIPHKSRHTVYRPWSSTPLVYWHLLRLRTAQTHCSARLRLPVCRLSARNYSLKSRSRLTLFFTIAGTWRTSSSGRRISGNSSHWSPSFSTKLTLLSLRRCAG